MTGDLLEDRQVEVALLSEALRRHDRYVARGIAPSDFFSEAHQRLAEAIEEVAATGASPNVENVSLTLQRAGKLDSVGGLRGVAEIAAGCAAVPDHERLKELARLRSVRLAALDVVHTAERGQLHEALACLSDAQTEALSGVKGKTLNVSELCQVTLEGIITGKDGAKRVHPGIAEFADKVGFLPLGSLTVIGGDTNVGKSGFVLEMMFCASERNVGCGLISMEDPEEITGSRVLATVSGVSSRNFQRGTFEPGDREKLIAGAAALKRLGDKMTFENCIGGNEVDVCAAMTRMASRGAKLVIVDYLQEVEPSKKQQDRRNEVRWVCKRLKAHAKRLNIALVCVTQITRPEKGQHNKEPTKHDIKESGDVTNMSEVVLMLWREQESDVAPVHVRATKIKWGGVGQRWSMQRGPSGRLRSV